MTHMTTKLIQDEYVKMMKDGWNLKADFPWLPGIPGFRRFVGVPSLIATLQVQGLELMGRAYKCGCGKEGVWTPRFGRRMVGFFWASLLFENTVFCFMVG